MSSTKRVCLVAGAVAAMLTGVQLTTATALADPDTQMQPGPGGDPLHNIIYRARVDGVSRGATIRYAAENDQTQTANPTMVPGRTFEAQTVLPASEVANMRVSIQWPYSANLHCEILVDDTLVAQADDFIAPRVLPNREDPDYGALTCESPVAGVASVTPADPAAPLPDAAPSPAESRSG